MLLLFRGIAQVEASFGAGTGRIYLDEVSCLGDEDNVLDCNYTADHDCSHSEDAGVLCYSGMYLGFCHITCCWEILVISYLKMAWCIFMFILQFYCQVYLRIDIEYT